MAYVVEGSMAGQGVKIYNVEQAVGINGANAPGDVKLVQYFLRHIYAKAGGLSCEVDGWIGPITTGLIKRFQTDMKKGGMNVLVDGRVDRAMSSVSSVSKTVYAILIMNGYLLQREPHLFAAIPLHVPINPNPRPNPYNPRRDDPLDMYFGGLGRTWLPKGAPQPGRPEKIVALGRHDYLVVYPDGRTETWRVSGEFNPGDDYHRRY